MQFELFFVNKMPTWSGFPVAGELTFAASATMSMAKSATGWACMVVCIGTPLTTMYASPIVSTLNRSSMYKSSTSITNSVLDVKLLYFICEYVRFHNKTPIYEQKHPPSSHKTVYHGLCETWMFVCYMYKKCAFKAVYEIIYEGHC